MSPRWLAACFALAACSPRYEEPPPPPNPADEHLRKMREEQLADLRRLEESIHQRMSRPDPLPPPDPPPPQQQQQPRPPQQPAPSECISSGTLVSFEAGSALRACFDRNHDGDADRCVRWRPDGQPLPYDPAVDEVAIVEETEETPPEPTTFHSNDEHNDDERIEIDGQSITVCGYDRACARFMPRLGDEDAIEAVVTDADYQRAAITVTTGSGKRGHVELWDLDRGRRYARLAFRGLVADASHTFTVRLGRGALVAFAANDSDHTVTGAIHGLDGGFRGLVGGGARKLDLDGTVLTAGVLLVGEQPADRKPYVLHAIDLATGAPGRFVIPRVDDTTDELELEAVSPGVVGAVQWGKQLRLDVLDLRTRGMRTLRVPTC